MNAVVQFQASLLTQTHLPHCGQTSVLEWIGCTTDVTGECHGCMGSPHKGHLFLHTLYLILCLAHHIHIEDLIKTTHRFSSFMFYSNLYEPFL